MKTIFLNPSEIDRKWYIINAEGKRLGRVAAKAAVLLRGKHKPCFVPHQEIGDYVVIINAEKAEVSGNKASKKIYYRHTGYPGGIKSDIYEKMLARKPEFPMEHAVKGMLPKNRLGRKLFKNLKVYVGADHPHTAQKPELIENI
ncbi:MAG: 50S ribosomal protein L13 [Spirochaetales bacterium]|nr:50S ribosomal protein L13 [Spirochaetales bacterium]